MLYALAPSPYFTHSLRVSDYLDLHPRSMYVILMIMYLERITRVTKNQSSLTGSSFLGILLLLFICIVFMILCIGLIVYSILLFISWHVCIFICIVQWYWFIIVII